MELVIIGVLNGAFVFTADLIRNISIPVQCDFIKISSYGKNTISNGQIDLQLAPSLSLKGKCVLLVEDIIDTGLTAKFLIDYFKNLGCATVSLCVLVDNPTRRKTDIIADYAGFYIPDKFIVGYGIDYAEKYRDLPYLAEYSE